MYKIASTGIKSKIAKITWSKAESTANWNSCPPSSAASTLLICSANISILDNCLCSWVSPRFRLLRVWANHSQRVVLDSVSPRIGLFQLGTTEFHHSSSAAVTRRFQLLCFTIVIPMSTHLNLEYSYLLQIYANFDRLTCERKELTVREGPLKIFWAGELYTD